MKIVIVGAGPSGLFLAHKLLARNQNYQIEIFEKLDDPSSLKKTDGQEFGFGLWEKAQTWLKTIDGLWELITKEAVDLNAGKLILIPRRQLCAILINLLKERYGNNDKEKVASCSLNFQANVKEVALKSREIIVETNSGQQKITYDLLVAADGVHSTIRDAAIDLRFRFAIASNPQKYAFEQKSRPHLWKVLELPKQPDWEQTQPRMIRLQKRTFWSIDAFGAYIPRHNGSWNALIFWQPKNNNERNNPCGVKTIDELQRLLHQMQSPTLSIPQLEPDKAEAFLTKRPSHEYWSQLNCYHHQEGSVAIIGDAAHAMFSFFAQGCTAALADAIALDCLLEKHNNDLKLVLPEFSNNRVAEGQAVSNLSLITLVFFHPFYQLFYGVVSKISTSWLKRPSILVRINQINTNYTDVLRENQLWVWLGKRLFKKMSRASNL